jgi:hypothetical protein
MQQIKFTIETKYGPYTDLIANVYHQTWTEQVTDEEGNEVEARLVETRLLTDEEIEAEKLKRVSEWFRHCFSEEFSVNTP